MDDFLKNIPEPHKLYMLSGLVLIAGSIGVELPFIPFTVPGNLQIIAIGTGVFLMTLGWVANEGNKKRRLARQELDAKFRAQKLDAGANPDDDKTVFKSE